MPQIINTNIASLNAQRNLNKNQAANDLALQRLSSGLRINSAKDDAAGLAISTRFDAQIRGTNVAVRNAGDAISLAQTAEGALNSITTNLQRIRELAVQSANDTNTDVDRVALQQEVDQLTQEIDKVSKQTNFNGKKLLDGSFSTAKFQTGANVGETISFGIKEASVGTLGVAQTAGVSSTSSAPFLSDGNNTAALAAGDLVLNGFSVGASSGADDTTSVYDKSSSAIAKAAAINAISDQTGVTATVNENTVAGTSVASSTSATGNVTINGVDISVASDANLSVETNLTNVANAINEKSGQTGVTATYDRETSSITLTAEDGRNITLLGDGTVDTTTIGLASADTTNNGTTYTGTFTLSSKDGSDITVDTTTGTLDNAGLQVGTYSGQNGGAVGDNVSGNALTTGDLVINGVAVGPTVASFDSASTANNSGSAIAVAAAINAVSDKTGVTAEVNANVLTSDKIDTAAQGGNIAINGVTVSVSYQASDDIGTKQKLTVDAINAVAGQTGIRAEAFGADQFRLVAEDGRNIELGAATNTGGNMGFDSIDAGVSFSSVTLVSAGKVELGSTTGNIANSGFKAGSYGGSESGTLLKDLDITTVGGAENAIKAVDNALRQVASQASELGAIQNRFDLTTQNLQATSENLSAANSRIRDADFAAETAALSRSQVLQQAGISVLAQANAKPQQVLSLLQ